MQKKQKVTEQPKIKSIYNLKSNMKKYWPYYIMVLPGVIYFLIIRYIPMLGSIIAFQDYNVTKGILGSKMVGFKHFRTLLNYPEFKSVFSNTLILGLLKTVVIFPIPVILSIMLNEVKNLRLKKVIQTAVYIPYFLSWVIVGGLIFDIFGVGGLFNNLRNALGFDTVLAMQKETWFRPIYVFSSIWKEAGWGTVVYLAAISGIDPETYEAASIDGSSRFQMIRYITLPLLLPTILTLFLLNIGGFLELGFDQVFNLITPMTRNVADIFDTYVYRVGILKGQYSITTAVGLFQSVIGLVLVTSFNRLANKFTDDGGLW